MRLAKMLQARALEVRATSAHIQVSPARFTAFVAWLGVVLSVGQTVVAKVAYDGVEPKDLEGDERAVAKEIFGDVETVPEDARSTFVAVCGGRGGKSYVLVALRMVHGMFTRDLSSAAPGQHPAALVIAPNGALRQEVINYAVGAIRSKPELKACLIVPKGTPDDGVVSGFSIRRPDGGKVVDFVAGVATKGGYGGRGRSWTDAALDECAFFQDSTFQVNDQALYDAASARVLPGGQTLVTSTPWAESGLLYEKHHENFGKPKTALVAHAPTLTINPSDWAKKIVARGYATDPENAEREYGARFMKGGTTVFFPPDLIESCIDDSLNVDEPRMPQPGDAVSAGGDLGFRSDSASLAITHRTTAGLILLGELLEMQPRDQPEGRLRPKKTIAAFRERMEVHGATTLMGDQYYAETADEELHEAGFAFFQCPASTDEVYVRTRQRMRDGLVRFARHPRLIQQLKEVKGRPTSGGKMSIINPRWAKGGHGDNASAFVLGVWQLVSDTVEAPPPAEDSAEGARAAKQARYERMLADEAATSHRQRGPGGGVGASRSNRGRRS